MSKRAMKVDERQKRILHFRDVDEGTDFVHIDDDWGM